VSRLPIRLRLTAAFALAMTVVLVATGVVVYGRLRDDLTAAVDGGLTARADGAEPAAPAGDPEEAFGEILAVDGGVVRRSGRIRGVALDEAERRRAARRVVVTERSVPGIEGTARVRARPGASGRVIVVGQSLQDRDDALAGLVRAFALGGPLAVLLASGLGYVLAAAGLRPVEAMRRRAAEVSLRDAGERLPLPAARDEVRRLGETLNAMLARLRGALEHERQFVAEASHELRTPIAVVKTELEGALRAGDHGPRTQAGLVAALEEADNLARLAEDLLVLARAGDGELPVRAEPVDVPVLLETVRREASGRAQAAGRGIEVAATAGLRVEADPLRLRQALGNLVDNALRHGSGAITLEARETTGGVELAVGDEGPGIPPGLSGRAFERFTRGEDARGRDGAGLGLAIVRAVAAAHGGHAGLDPGRPARVVLWLPVGGSPASQTHLSAPSHHADHQP
jgi:signal transduction histidine kinase